MKEYHRCTPRTPIKNTMGFHSHFEHCLHVGFFTLRSGRCEKSIWQINYTRCRDFKRLPPMHTEDTDKKYDGLFYTIIWLLCSYYYNLKISCFFYHKRPNRFMEILQDPLLEKLTENVNWLY